MATTIKKRMIASAVAAVWLLQSLPVSAMGLVEAYEAALQNDPLYRSAVHDNEAGQQNRELGRSNLLPSLAASYSTSKNKADITQPDFFGNQNTTHPEYTSTSAGVNLRQTLFNLDAYARYNQGIAQSNYSEALFTARGQDLVIRLVSAYADAKFAEDQLALATIQRDAFAEQRQVNERMFQKGEGTRTDMLETQARYDLAEAQLLEARDNLINARNSLAAMVGVDVTQLDQLSDDFKVKPMQPSGFEEWKAIALERNAEIAAARYQVETAEQEIKKQRAGHAPRVDFVAGFNKASSETLTTRNQDSTVKSLGVQVNIPLYSGGAVSALTTQAVANHQKAKSDLDAKTNQVLVELRKQYHLAQSSASRIEALVKSVDSARLLVQATQQSVKGGVRINLDVLNAQQQLYMAQRDLAQARYSYLVSYLRLRFAAGTLNAEDLHTVAGYFVKGGGNLLSEKPVRIMAKAYAVQPAASTPVMAQPSAPADSTKDDVLKLVQRWAQAWSAQDVDAYLGFYAGDFQTPKKQARDVWAKERETRIKGKSRIAVKVESPTVNVQGETATVAFRQVYQSDGLSQVTQKSLVLARQGGEWKIRQETSGG
ncbi:TolC family outer membrane protein [Noviherbaspirillum denitrificans]|uniref:TolC family outer membrane protein n=1 Tax=Noviherbaspirillum denitrificans TaxID=1968433 RepID=UPI000B52C324|nr:TolC family outer membrane protein [Noviherbaspirillum denitrificans]